MKREYTITGYNKYNVYCYLELQARDESEARNKAIERGIVNILSIEEEDHRYDYLCEEPIYK